jgi:hypothetical protein
MPMKKLICLLLLTYMLPVTSCQDKLEPEVETNYLDYGTRKEMREQALRTLHDYYIVSDKSKNYYEVIAREADRFILNYYPAGELLSFCNDQGSGWSQQYRVDLSQLKRLADLSINLDTLHSFIYRDTIISKTAEWVDVKTNGEPTIHYR